jgi:predicted nucleic acid-binding protein
VIAYLDSSVLLRLALGERGRLAAWANVEQGVTSVLAEVECLRTLDRLRRREELDDAALTQGRQTVLRLLEALEVIALTPPLLRRAADPFPTPLGTLDALHLATALAWKEARAASLVLATHDVELGRAATACGLEVIGTARG